MKVRNGFVSNSSSSSFIINGDINPAQFIIDIIPYLEKDRRINWEKKENLYDEELNNAKKILESNSPEDNVVFTGTINYETYVVYEGKTLLIDTCNNEEWDDIFESLGYDYICHRDEDEVSDIIGNNTFIDLQDMEVVDRKTKNYKIYNQHKVKEKELLEQDVSLTDNFVSSVSRKMISNVDLAEWLEDQVLLAGEYDVNLDYLLDEAADRLREYDDLLKVLNNLRK